MGFTTITMKHFVNFGIIENIKSSTGKQRVGAGAGLLGLAAAGGYAGYRALKGDSIDLEQGASYLKSGARVATDKASELYGQAKDQVWNAYQKPSLDSYTDYTDLQGVSNNIPQSLQGVGEEKIRDGLSDGFGMMRAGETLPSNLKGTVEGVYRNQPNIPRNNLYDAIRYPDLRGEQLSQTGERLKSVAGNVAKGTVDNIGKAGRGIYDALKSDPRMLQAQPEDYFSGKYNLDNLSTQDTLTLYGKMKERGLPDADRMLSRVLKKGFLQQ